MSSTDHQPVTGESDSVTHYFVIFRGGSNWQAGSLQNMSLTESGDKSFKSSRERHGSSLSPQSTKKPKPDKKVTNRSETPYPSENLETNQMTMAPTRKGLKDITSAFQRAAQGMSLYNSRCSPDYIPGKYI
jgi:hypothetical protein